MILSVPYILVYATVTIILCIEAWYDFKDGEIHPEMAGLMYGLCLTELLLFEPAFNWEFSLAGLAIGFIGFFLLALFGKGGGGDALLMGAVGAVLGAEYLAYIIVFSAVTYLVQGIVASVNNRRIANMNRTVYYGAEPSYETKEPQQEEKNSMLRMSFPYIPHVAMGWITTMCWLLIH